MKYKQTRKPIKKKTFRIIAEGHQRYIIFDGHYAVYEKKRKFVIKKKC